MVGAEPGRWEWKHRRGSGCWQRWRRKQVIIHTFAKRPACSSAAIVQVLKLRDPALEAGDVRLPRLELRAEHGSLLDGRCQALVQRLPLPAPQLRRLCLLRRCKPRLQVLRLAPQGVGLCPPALGLRRLSCSLSVERLQSPLQRNDKACRRARASALASAESGLERLDVGFPLGKHVPELTEDTRPQSRLHRGAPRETANARWQLGTAPR